MSIPEDDAIDQSSFKGSRKLSLQHNVIDANGSQSQIARVYSAGSLDSLHYGRQAEIFNEVLYNRRESKRSLSHHLSRAKIDEEEPNDENVTTVVEAQPKHSGNIFRRGFDWLVDTFDLTLLKDVTFVNCLIGISLADFGELNFMMITPMILDELNYSIVEVASLMSTIAIADIVFRFLSPFIGDLLRQSPRLMFIHGMIIFIFARLGNVEGFCGVLTLTKILLFYLNVSQPYNYRRDMASQWSVALYWVLVGPFLQSTGMWWCQVVCQLNDCRRLWAF